MKKEKTKEQKVYKPGSLKYVGNKILHSPTAMIGACFIILLFIVSFISPYICKYSYKAIDMKMACALPSLEHPFGCDEVGRDILSRVLYGAKYTMSIGFLTTGIACGFGVLLGSIAGYFGGKVDGFIMRALDVAQAFPGILLAITISAVLGPGFIKVIIALGISAIPSYARMMRANILTIRSSEYIEAESSINCPTGSIIFKHIIPNAMSPLIVQAAMGIASAGLAASALSFLGFGVQAPTPEWGAMLSSARDKIRNYPHLCMFPGLFIMLTVVAYNLIGDTIRDALDPKLKD
jgi:ABC-type dipeptide/oligopeptide/nickel transport system permease subunit